MVFKYSKYSRSRNQDGTISHRSWLLKSGSIFDKAAKHNEMLIIWWSLQIFLAFEKLDCRRCRLQGELLKAGHICSKEKFAKTRGNTFAKTTTCTSWCVLIFDIIGQGYLCLCTFQVPMLLCSKTFFRQRICNNLLLCGCVLS